MRSGVAIATSKSMNPPSTRATRSSAPTTSAPASSAARAASPWAKTATRTSCRCPWAATRCRAASGRPCGDRRRGGTRPRRSRRTSPGPGLHQLERLDRLVELLPVVPLGRVGVLLAVLHSAALLSSSLGWSPDPAARSSAGASRTRSVRRRRDPSSGPCPRPGPSRLRGRSAFRSGIFCSAIACTWALVTLPAFSIGVVRRALLDARRPAAAGTGSAASW